MQKVTFKQYHSFVSAEDELSEEQITEIFGKFFGRDNDKMAKMQATKDEIKKAAEAKKKEIDKKKDELFKSAKANAERPGGQKDNPLMRQSTSQMRAGAKRAVDRDPFGMAFESVMSEIDQEIKDLLPDLESGKVELYDILGHTDKTDLSSKARSYLQHMYDSIAGDRGFHADDDFEQIIDQMYDDLKADFG